MNQLITSDIEMSSLDIAEIVGKKHQHVMRDIRNEIKEIGSEIGQSIFGQSSYINAQNKEQPCYKFGKDGAMQLALKYDAKTRYRVIKHIEELENQQSEIDKPSYMIDDPVKRAEKWINEQKEKQQLEQQQKLDAPYTNFGKTVFNSNASINVGAFAKMVYDEHGIKIGRNRLFAWLRNNGYLIKSGREKNHPKQPYIEQGLFDTSVTVVSHNTKGNVQHVTPLVTGKGQVKLTEKLINEFSQEVI